ncbi:unnamed protein product [Phytophthora lilii]|uniref:RxLR effector protein n=1 Tax=Phytophthora lilii TaxID=2077276 RepID=A0A9W6YHM3_9STRA|nr:unnamed protein product [Phytophthora lilii]
MRLSPVVLVATATLLANYDTVSAATNAEHTKISAAGSPNVMQSVNVAPLNARFLRSFKREVEEQDDDELKTEEEERGYGNYPFLVFLKTPRRRWQNGLTMVCGTASWKRWRTSPTVKHLISVEK